MKLPHLMGEKNGYLMSSPILDTPQKITNSLQVNVENPIPKDLKKQVCTHPVG